MTETRFDHLVSAARFSTNCTLPTESTTLVSSTDIRETFEIIWSGLFTIFICIWTVQHLNVPPQLDGRDRGLLGDLKWASKAIFIKLKYMAFTLILPEFMAAKAFAEMMTARQSMERVKEMTCEDGTKLFELEISNWTTIHAFYAEMGGFVIRAYGNHEIRHLAMADKFVLRETVSCKHSQRSA